MKKEVQGETLLEEVKCLKETVYALIKKDENCKILSFLESASQLKDKLVQIQGLLKELEEQEPLFKNVSEKLFVNILDSFERISIFAITKSSGFSMKLEFELGPFIRVLYLVVYYCQNVKGDPEKEAYFEKEEYPKLLSNEYVEESEKTGQYPYDLSINILAFNQLDYTKKCVQSFLDTVDPTLNYEFILINHGSDDGTKEYFESIGATKQIDMKENDLMFSFLATFFIYQGKYLCGVTNDVILGKNAISNLLTCIQSDETFRFVVPSTTNMKNNQVPKLPEGCDSVPDILKWAEGNNVSNPYMWEQRVILFNPVSMYRASDLVGDNALLRTPFFVRFNGCDHRDTMIATQVRRSKNKCILAKDAFCYHHDHITRRLDENFKNPEHYKKVFHSVEKAIGISLVPTGRCYSNNLMNQLDFSGSGHKDVLGLNCGLGANPLKVKESLKEFSHNLDCYITNIQETQEFMLDLSTLSDEFLVATDFSTLQTALLGKTFDYIIFEDPFTFALEEMALYSLLKNALKEKGVLLLGQPTEKAKEFFTEHKIISYINHETGIDCLVWKP